MCSTTSGRDASNARSIAAASRMSPCWSSHSSPIRASSNSVSRYTLLVAVAGAAVLYGLFGLLLGIPVPRGIWLPLLG